MASGCVYIFRLLWLRPTALPCTHDWPFTERRSIKHSHTLELSSNTMASRERRGRQTHNFAVMYYGYGMTQYIQWFRTTNSRCVLLCSWRGWYRPSSDVRICRSVWRPGQGAAWTACPPATASVASSPSDCSKKTHGTETTDDPREQLCAPVYTGTIPTL